MAKAKAASLDEIIFFRLTTSDKKKAERVAKREGFETASAWYRAILLKRLAQVAA